LPSADRKLIADRRSLIGSRSPIALSWSGL
jgi:hypothetical protein